MSSVVNSLESYPPSSTASFSKPYPSTFSETHPLPSVETYLSPTVESYPPTEHYSASEPHPSRRRYSESLKIEAARLVLEQNLSMQKVAIQLHCSPMSVKKWVDQYRGHVTQRPNAPTHPTTQRQPLQQNSMPFLPVQVVGKSIPSNSYNHFEIITQSGLTLRLPSEMAIGILVGLVRELESASC